MWFLIVSWWASSGFGRPKERRWSLLYHIEHLPTFDNIVGHSTLGPLYMQGDTYGKDDSWEGIHPAKRSVYHFWVCIHMFPGFLVNGSDGCLKRGIRGARACKIMLVALFLVTFSAAILGYKSSRDLVPKILCSRISRLTWFARRASQPNLSRQNGSPASAMQHGSRNVTQVFHSEGFVMLESSSRPGWKEDLGIW